jgi:glycosyltransferase involved in cell wall biosynthesis
VSRFEGLTMKILYLIDSLGYGGAERLLVDIVPRLKKRGADLLVVCVRTTMPLAQQLVEMQVPVISLECDGTIYSPKQLLQAGRRFRNIVRHESVQIIHSHLFTSDILSSLNAPASCRLISTLHSRDPWWYQRRRLRSIGKTLVDGVSRRWRRVRTIAVSQDVQVEAISALGIHPTDIRVVNNGIDLSRFAMRKAEKGDKKTIIQVARFYPEKGHKVALMALAELLKEHGNLQLVLIGSGPEESSVHREAVRLGIEHCIRFMGTRNDVPEQLQKADIFWMPSKWEGLPIACIEAMSCRLPVVASRVGGLPELVIHGQTGFLINPDSHTQLAEATSKLLQDHDLSIKLGANGRTRAEKSFSIDTTADQYMCAYNDMLDGRW